MELLACDRISDSVASMRSHASAATAYATANSMNAASHSNNLATRATISGLSAPPSAPAEFITPQMVPAYGPPMSTATDHKQGRAKSCITHATQIVTITPQALDIHGIITTHNAAATIATNPIPLRPHRREPVRRI